jgi:hypothetical protein
VFRIQREKFRATAKLTHRMYGRRRSPAVLEILRQYWIVSRMATHRRAISMSPRRGDLSPKKTTDHKVLRIS